MIFTERSGGQYNNKGFRNNYKMFGGKKYLNENFLPQQSFFKNESANAPRNNSYYSLTQGSSFDKKPIQKFRGLEFSSISRKIATICTKMAMPYTKSRNSQEILGLKLQFLSKPLQNTLPIQTKMNHADSFFYHKRIYNGPNIKN